MRVPKLKKTRRTKSTMAMLAGVSLLAAPVAAACDLGTQL